MKILVGNQFLEATAEPPFALKVNGQARAGGVFDRFRETVEFDELMHGGAISSISNEVFPAQPPPPFLFSAVISDRRFYAVGSKVYLIHFLQKGALYRQSLVDESPGAHQRLLYHRELVSDSEWYVHCLEELQIGNYSVYLSNDQCTSQARFRVLPIGPAQPPPVPYQVVHHYPDSFWESYKGRKVEPDGSYHGSWNDHCQVEIVTEGVLEYRGIIEGPTKMVPDDFFSQFSIANPEFVTRDLCLSQGENTTRIHPDNESRPLHLGANNFVGKVAWPGASFVDGLYFSGSTAEPSEQARATGVWEQGPWCIRYALVGERESFRIYPPPLVNLDLRHQRGYLEMESPLTGQALLILGDPEGAGSCLSDPYAATLLSWLGAAAFRCGEGPLREVQLSPCGDFLVFSDRAKLPMPGFHWVEKSDFVSRQAEPVRLQQVQILELTAGTPRAVAVPADGPGLARLYLFAAGRLHFKEFVW